MTWKELHDECVRAVKGSGVPYVILFLRGRSPTGFRVRLLKSRGPLGEILCVKHDGTTARFPAWAIIRYIKKHKLLECHDGKHG